MYTALALPPPDRVSRDRLSLPEHRAGHVPGAVCPFHPETYPEHCSGKNGPPRHIITTPSQRAGMIPEHHLTLQLSLVTPQAGPDLDCSSSFEVRDPTTGKGPIKEEENPTLEAYLSNSEEFTLPAGSSMIVKLELEKPLQ